MHGSINQLVCSECSAVAAMTPASLKSLRAKRGIPCRACEAASVRMRIMLYDDAEGAHCSTHGYLQDTCKGRAIMRPLGLIACPHWRCTPRRACTSVSMCMHIMIYAAGSGHVSNMLTLYLGTRCQASAWRLHCAY